MKTILHYIWFLLLPFFGTQLRAQCTVSDQAIELVSAVPLNGQCRVIFNYSFYRDVNNGNKHSYIHLWNTSQYPNLMANGLAYKTPSDHPDPTDLAAVLATIVLTNAEGGIIIDTVYEPYPQVSVLSEGLSASVSVVNGDTERITVNNITLIVPNCSGSGITGDTWSSQAANGNAHCVTTGFTFVVGNPRVDGLLYCTLPRKYNVSIQNLSAVAIVVRYNIYVDDADGIYEPTADLKVNTTPFGPFTILASGTYQSGMQEYHPYDSIKPYVDRSLWVEVITEGIPNKTVRFINNFCIPLPVSFASFTSYRNGDLVILNWETATESNNNGFEVERKIGTGQWQVIDFIISKAPGGNSDTRLTYTYIDLNPTSGITEYRIKQVDFDRQASYSKVNAVKGIGFRTGILVYPNPSHTGQVQVVMDDMNNHTIYIYDGGGRKIRQWNNYTDNNLTVTGLQPGYYLVKVVDRITGRIENKKFIIMQ